MNQILDKLEKVSERSYERKAIYNDIGVLNTLTDLNIHYDRRLRAYSVSKSNVFSKEEIEIITNAVLTAKFISHQETSHIINEFHGLTGYFQDRAALNNIRIEDRIKITQVDVAINIKAIREAIKCNKKIQFDYSKYNTHKDFVIEKHDCIVSPYEDVWYQDFYYMLGNFEDKKISHYRVDRMKDIKILDLPRKSINEVMGNYQGFNLAEYMSKNIGMSSGKEDFVTIKFRGEQIGEIIDNLGDKVSVIEDNTDYFTLRARVNINKKFVKWILSFGDNAYVLKPKSLREEVEQSAERLYESYRMNKDLK